MKSIKVRGITNLSKITMKKIRGGACSYTTPGGTTYHCDTYHIVINGKEPEEPADSLTVHH